MFCNWCFSALARADAHASWHVPPASGAHDKVCVPTCMQDSADEMQVETSACLPCSCMWHCGGVPLARCSVVRLFKCWVTCCDGHLLCRFCTTFSRHAGRLGAAQAPLGQTAMQHVCRVVAAALQRLCAAHSLPWVQGTVGKGPVLLGSAARIKLLWPPHSSKFCICGKFSRVPTFVHTSVLLRERGQRLLSTPGSSA